MSSFEEKINSLRGNVDAQYEVMTKFTRRMHLHDVLHTFVMRTVVDNAKCIQAKIYILKRYPKTIVQSIITYEYKDKDILHDIIEWFYNIKPYLKQSRLKEAEIQFSVVFKAIIKEMYTSDLEQEIIEYLHHPIRVHKWLNNNPDKHLEDYLA